MHLTSFLQDRTLTIALTGEIDYEDSLKAFSIMKKGFKAQTVQASRILVSACKGEENIYIPLSNK